MIAMDTSSSEYNKMSYQIKLFPDQFQIYSRKAWQLLLEY